MEYKIVDISKNELIIIKHLWEKLNKMHLEDSLYFRNHYQNFLFEDRIKSFSELDDNQIKITTIQKNEEIYGYCLSSKKNNKGEIESLYLSENVRNNNFGKILVEQHISWFKQNNCKKIIVTVAYGHESVLGFYPQLSKIS